MVRRWVAVTSVQLDRVEGCYSPTAYTPLAAGAIGIRIVVFPAMF